MAVSRHERNPVATRNLEHLCTSPNLGTDSYVNSDGREEYMCFKFERDGSSISKALRLGLTLEPSAMEVDIPVFYAEGLQVSR